MTMAETDNFLKLLRNPQEMERALWKEPLTKNQILVFCSALQLNGHVLLANHFGILHFGLLT